jgi:hypothetical protein
MQDPQSLNRYAYCVNNPLKYIDPSGLDYVVVLGSGQEINSEADIDRWYEWVHSNFPVQPGEICIFLPDIDPENFLALDFYDVTPRLTELNKIMSINALTDIKLVGYSEGAATVASYLADTDNINENLTAAFMLERPTWGWPVISGYNPFINVPEKVEQAKPGIIMADIWNTASIVHNSPIDDWGERYSYPYDSRSFLEKVRTFFLGSFIDSSAFYSGYHSDIIKPHNAHLMTVSYSLLGG